MLTDTDKNDIRDYFKVPEHVYAWANAIRYDLLHGPSWVRLPEGDPTKFTADDLASFREDLEKVNESDILEETYVGKLAKAFKDYLDDLPSDAYYNKNCGNVSTSEPEGWTDEEGEWIEPEWDDVYKLEHRDILECLFGKTIANEFR